MNKIPLLVSDWTFLLLRWTNNRSQVYAKLALCLCATWMLTLFATPIGLHAQSTDDAAVSKISKEILDLIRRNLEAQPARPTNSDLSPTDDLFNVTVPDLDLSNNDHIYRHKIKQLKKDLGVNVKAQYFVNHDQSYEAEAATEGNLSGDRTRVGIEWNVIKNGWIGNSNKARIMDKRRKLDKLQFEMENNDSKVYYRYNLLIYLFNKNKIKLYSARLAQLTQQQKLLYQIYFLKGILYEEIIAIKSNIEQVKVQLKNYKEYNDWFESTLGNTRIQTNFDLETMPILSIDLDYLLHENSKEILLDSIHQLEQDIAFSENKPINELSLRVQAYRNMTRYKDEVREARSFNSIGLGLAVPLKVFFNKKSNTDLAYAKIQERNKFNVYTAHNTSSEIINYYYQYNYKMKTYMEFIHKEILYKERIRVEVVNQKNYKDIYRSLKILNHLDVLRNIQTEMLDLKQQMYLLLLKIYSKTHYHSIQDFVNVLAVEDFYQRLPANRLMTISSKDLLDNKASFIKDYLISNGIKRIQLEEGLDTKMPKIIALKKELFDKNIEMAKTLDGRGLLNYPTDPSMPIKYALTVENFDGVVLDFSKYNTPEKRKLVKQFLLSQFEVFQYDIGAEEGTTRFQIKLSPGYPIDFLNVLAKETDLLTFAIHRPSELDYLEELANAGFTQINKIALDISNQNFKNRLELEAYIDMLNNVYGIQHIHLNNLNAFLEIDTQTIVKIK